ncbi:MAG TPA: O-antigen ligase domain-containing protein [Candidatus Marinimicrobia bacterium]|nr:O-antigen ligase domain-containing protein [Candidatus Neomarinimicrobiota bacterium]
MKRWHIALFILLESVVIIYGIKIHPILPLVLAFLIPLGVLLLWLPELTLNLFFLIGVIKGWLIANIPLFQSLDITILLAMALWGGVFVRFLQGRVFLTESRKHFYIPFLIFGIIILLTGLYTPSKNYGSEKVLSFWVFTHSIFLAPLLLLHTKEDLKRFFMSLLAIIALTSVIMAYNLVHAFVSGQLFGYLVRLSVFGSNPIGVARIVAIGIGFAAVYIVRKDKNELIASVMILLILIPTLFSTGSRGPLVSLFLAALVYILFLEQQNRQRIYSLSIILFLLLALFLLILPESITKRFLEISGDTIVVTETGIERVSTIASRLHFWEMAFQNWLSTPSRWLSGFGSGSFSNLFVWRDFRWYPHNIFVEILYELGILGLSLFLLMWSAFAKAVFSLKKIKSIISTQPMLIIIAMLILFFASFFSGDINSNRLYWMLFASAFAVIEIDTIT